MPLKLFVGITDRDWYELLRGLPELDEVNFWGPGGTPFKALRAGELFLFKLHAPDHFIVGGGVFAHDTSLPCSLTWETFGQANGASTLTEMRARIARYRRSDLSLRDDFVIGCRILTQPFSWTRATGSPCPRGHGRSFKARPTPSMTPMERLCGRLLQPTFNPDL